MLVYRHNRVCKDLGCDIRIEGGIGGRLTSAARSTGSGNVANGAIGAPSFLVAFTYKIVAVDQRSVAGARRWIGRIVFGTIGVKIAETLTHAIISTVLSSVH